MIVAVRLLAFGKPGEIRMVNVVESSCRNRGISITDGPEPYLDMVYHYGQNEIQEQPHPSVSMGDVIIAEGRFFLVKAMGFAEITSAQLAAYEALPRIDRQFSELVRGKDSV